MPTEHTHTHTCKKVSLQRARTCTDPPAAAGSRPCMARDARRVATRLLVWRGATKPQQLPQAKGREDRARTRPVVAVAAGAAVWRTGRVLRLASADTCGCAARAAFCFFCIVATRSCRALNSPGQEIGSRPAGRRSRQQDRLACTDLQGAEQRCEDDEEALPERDEGAVVREDHLKAR